MRTVEATPRLTIQQIKSLPGWTGLAEQRRFALVIQHDGVNHLAVVSVTTDLATFGTRYWLLCMRCGSRRMYLHWDADDGELLCRRCARLVYAEQAWPDSRWRAEVGRPLLRAVRRAAA